MSHIAFPGLGLEFEINRTAFTVFGLKVQWYALIIVTGIILGMLYFMRKGIKTEKISEDDLMNICILIIPISIIGARLTYVLTSLEKFDSFWDAFKIWEGGIAIYGAIIFGLLTVIIYCKVKKISALKVLDALAPAVMIGQIIGRWGNFVNAEAYGWSEGVENLPWRMSVGRVYIDDVYHPEIEFVHPTFLYESLWNLIGFIIINIFYRHKKRDGQVFYMYIGWYGLGRGIIEMIRTDSLRVGNIKLFVVLGLGSFIASIILFIISCKKAKAEKEEEEKYLALSSGNALNADSEPTEEEENKANANEKADEKEEEKASEGEEEKEDTEPEEDKENREEEN